MAETHAAGAAHRHWRAQSSRVPHRPARPGSLLAAHPMARGVRSPRRGRLQARLRRGRGLLPPAGGQRHMVMRWLLASLPQTTASRSRAARPRAWWHPRVPPRGGTARGIGPGWRWAALHGRSTPRPSSGGGRSWHCAHSAPPTAMPPLVGSTVRPQRTTVRAAPPGRTGAPGNRPRCSLQPHPECCRNSRLTVSGRLRGPRRTLPVRATQRRLARR